MAKVEKLLDGVWRWKWYSEDKGMYFNGWAVRLAQGLLFIDPAYADESVWSELASLGKPFRILLTNKDHERASDELRGRFKVPVLAHEADAPLLAAKPEETFGDGAELFGAFKVVRFERLKSPGEVALFWAARRILIVGDAITGHPAGRLGLVMKHQGKPEVLADLQRLLPLDFDTLLVGDGEPMLTGAKDALRRFLPPPTA